MGADIADMGTSDAADMRGDAAGNACDDAVRALLLDDEREESRIEMAGQASQQDVSLEASSSGDPGRFLNGTRACHVLCACAHPSMHVCACVCMC